MTRDALTAKIVQEFKQASDAWSPHCRFPGSHKFREYRGKLDYHLDQIEAARDELRAKAAERGHTLGDFLKLPHDKAPARDLYCDDLQQEGREIDRNLHIDRGQRP
jgi:hypothetical protein